MPSVLSCFQSIRAVAEREGDSPERVLHLFLPLLRLLETEERSTEQVLTDALSEHLSRNHTRLPLHSLRDVRIQLEKRAQPYCSAGDLDALPMDLLSHSLSFLSYQDRMPVECVCRALLIQSRNTAIQMENIVTSELYDHHLVAPTKLVLNSSISAQNLACLETNKIQYLRVCKRGNAASLLGQSFPSLKCLTCFKIPMSQIISDDCGIWEFSSVHQIDSLILNRCGDISADHWITLGMKLSQHRCVRGLKIMNVRVRYQFAIEGEGLELDYLLFRNCDMNVALLSSLVNCDLEWLGFFNGMLRSPVDGSAPDWSFLDLPNLERLDLECGGCLTFKELSSIIDDYGPLWCRLNYASFSLGQLKFTELCDFLHRCSIFDLCELSLSISNLEPGDPSIKIADFSDILDRFPNLNGLFLHFKAIESRIEATFHRWMVELYHLHQSGQINIEITLGDGGILDRFKQLCMDRKMVSFCRRWILIDPSYSIFGMV